MAGTIFKHFMKLVSTVFESLSFQMAEDAARSAKNPPDTSHARRVFTQFDRIIVILYCFLPLFPLAEPFPIDILCQGFIVVKR
jgi:hypothetical protein